MNNEQRVAIEKREAERAVLGRLLVKSENREWRERDITGELSGLRKLIGPIELREYMEREYPSLTPQAERVTLSDGSVWEYAPHISETRRRWPWKQSTNMTASFDPFDDENRRIRPASDYRAVADAMDRYESRSPSIRVNGEPKT